ncbi:MAG TPA: phage holin family protein [Candidatus Levybacteria bacterium]|nr:phage holin family protein [Candidatus Levybacteria bacterium]
MKGLLQSTVMNAIGLYATTLVASGLVIRGDYIIFAGASFTLVIVKAILKPLLSVFVFPFAFLSVAIVIVVSNIIGLYIVAVLFKSIYVTPFTLTLFGSNGLSFQIGGILSYVVISGIIALVVKALEWVFDLN